MSSTTPLLDPIVFPDPRNSSKGFDFAERPLSAGKRPSWILGLVVPAGLSLGWALGRLLPPPSRILHTFADLTLTGELANHVAATLGRVGLGFLLGVLSG